MNAGTESLPNAAVLEMTKPSGGMGMVRPLIVAAANGDVKGQRDIRDGYISLAFDESRPLAFLAASAECAVMMARLAASHGDLDDVVILADTLTRAAVLFDLASNAPISEARLVEALGLYRRLGDAGHDEAARQYDRISAAMPPAILERVEEDCLRLAAQIDDGAAVEGKRIH